MGQSQLTVNVITVKPFKDDMFEEFLGIDSDFTENTEYFREETLALGWRNEAHRISKELCDKFKKEWESNEEEQNSVYFEDLIDKYLEEATREYVGDSQFIIGNRNYTSQYEITTISDFSNYDEEITVVVSYLSK